MTKFEPNVLFNVSCYSTSQTKQIKILVGWNE